MPNKLKLSAKGFSLIELMVVLAIAGVLLGMSAPAIRAYLINSKIQATAQSFLSGLQQARAEAVRRNTTATMIMTDSVTLNDPSVTPSTTGKNWVLSTPNPDNTAVNTVINSKAVSEGSGATIKVTGSVASITFNGLGGTNAGATATFQFESEDQACGSEIRCINVVVTPGGRTQICDPSIASTAISDSRRCMT